MGETESHQYINQDSGNTEWWTPKAIVRVASKLMGGIDIDPACSSEAWLYHERHAHRYDSQNGIDWQWYGKVWLNHPFSRSEKACESNCTKKICQKRGYCTTDDLPGNEEWIAKLVRHHKNGDIDQACSICFAAVNAEWFEPLKRYPQFFFKGRVHYIDPGTLQPAKQVTKDSVFTWLFDSKEITYHEACQRLERTMLEFGYTGVAK